MKVTLLTAAIFIGSTTLAAAQSTPTIDTRQANQQNRINQGIAKGQINAREAANLQRGQARVQRIENRATADGVVTGREQARINRAQNVESRKIYNKRHNNR